MPQPLLTVVVPVYNTEKYLRECLDSIVNQTYTNLDIILVNDCSSDNSEDIILEYQKTDPRIKYFKHETNRAQGAARNTGIANATGEWITFVDSDDYIDLDTYQTMMDLILKNNVDMGIFSISSFDDITKKEIGSILHNTPTLTKIPAHTPNPSVCNKIFRLSDIVDDNLTFPEHLKCEDLEFWFKYTSMIEPTAICCPKKFYHYRQRTDSTMGQIGSNIVDLGNIYKNIYGFLIEKNLFDKYQDAFFLCMCSHGCNYLSTMPKEPALKLLSAFHDFLQQFPDEELIPYPELFTTKNLSVNEHSLEFLKNLNNLQTDNNNLQNDKWYRFGQLSRTQKIKFIIKTIIKKILKKLHIFEFIKSIKNSLFRR